ncbi:hypothetical protein [Sphingomonas bacterium]|uniref:hypothetical protein n=1 Tax=Sphingomonas bacterium TaxID=1895847 RepID=UPI0015776D40|nr:hypothetical protein [Sphingomonas bacterium]
MRRLLLISLLAVAAPAFAANEPVAHRGDMLRDSNNARLGSIASVRSDGSVGLILNSRMVIVPASSLSVVDGKLTTKLSKTEIASSN